MLKLKYIPVDADHESAVIEYDTTSISDTGMGLKFYDPAVEMDRIVSYDKLLRVEFNFDISDGMRNKAKNLMRLRDKNARKPHGSTTVK